jgi:hypothetical protein
MNAGVNILNQNPRWKRFAPNARTYCTEKKIAITSSKMASASCAFGTEAEATILKAY